MQASHGHADLDYRVENPDFMKFTNAYGIAGQRADTLEQFHHVLQDGGASGRTNLIELTVDLCNPP